ncbi:MAG: DUF4926 domain-containing protein [Alphaproteobacteria bacterium]|nr:DUF4926 domain-containing protein [Alphaproteobacteria bacterium]
MFVRDDKPAAGLCRGDAGTIIHIFRKSDPPAYLVEFVDPDGSTRAEEILTADQLSRTPPAP